MATIQVPLTLSEKELRFVLIHEYLHEVAIAAYRASEPVHIKLTLSQAQAQAQIDADEARIEQIAEEYYYQRGIEA